MLPGDFPANLLSAALLFAALEIAACLAWSRRRATSAQLHKGLRGGERIDGIGDRVLVWGGVAAAIGVAEMAAKGISEELSPSLLLENLLLGWLWGPILFTQEILVLAALVQAIRNPARRSDGNNPKICRPHHLLVGLILSLLMARGFEIALFGVPPSAWSPAGHLLADLFYRAGETALKIGYILSWWACVLTALLLLLRLAAGERPWRPHSHLRSQAPAQRA